MYLKERKKYYAKKKESKRRKTMLKSRIKLSKW